MQSEAFDDDIDFDSPFCAFCLQTLTPADVAHRDCCGNQWCEEHAHRGRVIDWGKRNGWPELDCGPHILPDGVVPEGTKVWEVLAGAKQRTIKYLIPSGAFYWQMMLAGSKDEVIGYLAEAAIEYIDQQRGAA